ncbi:MAG TPA: hypothetical protein VFJ59_18950, partial [Pseudolabrys sp.]|nr:hypothetical protein [Pseudolabrys sp.]
MLRSVKNGLAPSSAQRWLFPPSRVHEYRRQLTALATAASVLSLSTISFAVAANAVEANVRDGTFSALRDYVQLIDTGRKPAANADQNSNSF